jgi:NNP family nitrate/nitrite transporter-like MFS transporter
LADRIGGARVTFWNFLAMGGALIGVIYFLGHKSDPGAFWGFFWMFLVLFVGAGVGNGSTYRMVPVIFRTEKMRSMGQPKPGTPEHAKALRDSTREASTVIGFTSAFAAYGAFFVPKSYGTSIALTGTPLAALYGFLFFYATCVLMTWWFFSRKKAEVPC